MCFLSKKRWLYLISINSGFKGREAEHPGYPSDHPGIISSFKLIITDKNGKYVDGLDLTSKTK